ncbi:hypothetical protein VTK73DRAFT_3769 [Phialemonium thermophilum]|uniref:Uncharacterized protein n=1 Tax=Phialemonium thermophilum TaxID=223376 RepID=A0ABR3WXR4_9PEZI
MLILVVGLCRLASNPPFLLGRRGEGELPVAALRMPMQLMRIKGSQRRRGEQSHEVKDELRQTGVSENWPATWRWRQLERVWWLLVEAGNFLYISCQGWVVKGCAACGPAGGAGDRTRWWPVSQRGVLYFVRDEKIPPGRKGLWVSVRTIARSTATPAKYRSNYFACVILYLKFQGGQCCSAVGSRIDRRGVIQAPKGSQTPQKNGYTLTRQKRIEMGG